MTPLQDSGTIKSESDCFVFFVVESILESQPQAP
jgi:hypothetical protein